MKKVVLSVCCLLLASCGSNRGNQTTPLTADQRSQFGETLTSVGRVQKAGQQARTAEHRAAPANTDDTLQKMTAQLQAGRCEVTVPKSTASQDPNPVNTNVETGLKVSGGTCPIALDLSMKSTSKLSNNGYDARFDFSMSYSVSDPEFAKLNDITAIDVKGSGSVSAGNGSASGDLGVEGSVKSQSLGELKVYVVGKVEGKGDQNSVSATATTVLGIEYPGYTAELKQVLKIENKARTIEYYLNGQTITEQEFRDLSQKAGSLGAIKTDIT